MTATEHSATRRIGDVSLDVRDLARCRRRIHLDRDPTAVGSPRALPDPALEERQADAARHRGVVAEVVAQATDCLVLPTGLPHVERETATAAAVRAGSRLIWGARLPAAEGVRGGGADLLVQLPDGGYVPVVVVRHRVTDPGDGAITSDPVHPWPGAAVADPSRRCR